MSGTKLGIAGWNFRSLSFPQLLERLRQRYQLRYLDLWPWNIREMSAREVSQLANEAGVAIYCLNFSTDYRLNSPGSQDQIRDKLVEAVQFASELGAPYVQVYVGTDASRHPYIAAKLWKRTMAPALDIAASNGITITVENNFDRRLEDPHATNLSRRPETLLMLMEEVNSPHFKITFDPANFHLAGVEPYPLAYEILKHYVVNVHLKDVQKYSDLLHESQEAHAAFSDSITGTFFCVPVGNGAVNFDGIFRALKRDNYSGYLTLDPLTREDLLDTFCDRSMAYVRSNMERLGIPEVP